MRVSFVSDALKGSSGLSDRLSTICSRWRSSREWRELSLSVLCDVLGELSESLGSRK